LRGVIGNAPQVVKCRPKEMRTLQNTRDRNELLERMLRVGPNSEPRWGKMSAHQMICHLNDSLRAPLGEKYISPSTSLFKRAILKHLALWAPIRWPHASRHRPRWIRIRAAPHPYSLLRTLHNFATCLSDFVSTTANSRRTQCGGKCRGQSACAMRIFTSIITCGSSERETCLPRVLRVRARHMAYRFRFAALAGQ